MPARSAEAEAAPLTLRRQLLAAAVVDLLGRYRMPAGFDDARGACFVEAVAEALDRRLPSLPLAALAEEAAALCDRVAAAHDRHDWPTQPAFLRAAVLSAQVARPGPVGAQLAERGPRPSASRVTEILREVWGERTVGGAE